MDLIRDRKINLVRLSLLYLATRILHATKKRLNFNGCDTEIKLILAKSACFTTPMNIQEMTICPLHRERLGIGWRRSIIQCSVAEELSRHDDTAKQKAGRGCTLLQSKLILQAIGKIRSSWFRQANALCFEYYCAIFIDLCRHQRPTIFDVHSFIRLIILSRLFKRCYIRFFIRMLFFRPRLNILIFCRF